MNRREAIKVLTALPATATVSSAAVGPDDVIVIECGDVHLTMEGRASIGRGLERIWPGRKILILDRGYRIRLIRRETNA